MIQRLRDVRLIPIVLVAITALFALKAFGLIFEGGYTLTELSLHSAAEPEVTGAVGLPKRNDAPSTATPKAAPPRPQQQPKQQSQQQSQQPSQSWAQQMFGFPDVTGAVAESKSASPEPKGNRPAPKAVNPPPPAPVPPPPERLLSPAERAILERLARVVIASRKLDDVQPVAAAPAAPAPAAPKAAPAPLASADPKAVAAAARSLADRLRERMGALAA